MPYTFEQSKDEIAHLAKHFATNRVQYLAAAYKEAHARQEFIDPLFSALNWDVPNRQQAAPDYREVIIEDSLDIEGQKKAPDYAFRVGRERKFFAEAKKPGVDLKNAAGPAYQLRRYAWSAKLPLSILTDFEELAVYDCRLRPSEKDKPGVARVNYLRYEEYPDRWQEIWDVFARGAVLDGSFDRFAQSGKGRRGASEVDAEFLKEIEGWRDVLARNVALRNSRLTIDELNDAVQRTIDRVIFLRMAEDRGIEEYGRLQRLAAGEDIYAALLALSRQADARYNSGLFDFSKAGDKITPGLAVDDKALKPILADLYYPQSPYEFSVLPAEILGNVYEQFLGKVIRLTAAHQAKVEEKPEVKKAGGVYYTPAYIVEYIVKNTVGKQVEGKSPKQLKGFRVLDIACGSGSFLLGAYQYLLDYYRQWYTEHTPEKHSEAVWQQGEAWRLTTAEKKRILIEHIFGVDIDRQAVEVTKLSLLLKVLEGESDETLGKQLTLLQERALPNLDRNIKCGNSLIGPDYFSGQLLPDAEELQRVNPFDWAAEFPEAMQAGGFDCVIGNPPYGIVFAETVKPYLETNYQTFIRNNDLYVAFSQKALSLLKMQGEFGFIIPNTFLIGPYFDDFKRYVLSHAAVLRVVDFGLNQVFQAPNVFTSLLFLRKVNQIDSAGTNITQFTRVTELAHFPASLIYHSLTQEELNTLKWVPSDKLSAKLQATWPQLGEFAWVKDVGLNYWTQGRGKTRGGSIADKVLYEGERHHSKDRPYIKGRDIGRYSISHGNHWLRHNWERLLDPKVDTLRYSPEFLEREKIVYRQTSDRIVAALDLEGILTDKTLHTVVYKDSQQGQNNLRYLLGLLNSRVMNHVYLSSAREEGRTFAQVKTFRIKELPFRPINFSDPADEAQHDKVVTLVEQMLDLLKRKDAATDATGQERLQRLIDSTDKQIDALVYELYGLTPEEIAVVENTSK